MQPVRGKKGKMKRMAKRYGEQDDEERMLAMQAIGSVPTKTEAAAAAGPRSRKKERGKKSNRASAVAAAAAAAAASGELEASMTERERTDLQRLRAAGEEGGGGESKACFNCGVVGHVSKDCPRVVGGGGSAEAAAEVGDQQQGRLGRAAKREKKEKEESELRALMEAEGGGVEGVEGGGDEEAVFDGLTGRPLPDDALLFAVPVCAPYPALADFKYKVKLTPGTQKKGKSSRSALAAFLRLPPHLLLQREKELLKASPELEQIQTIVGSVKVGAQNVLSSATAAMAGVAGMEGGGGGGGGGGGKKGDKKGPGGAAGGKQHKAQKGGSGKGSKGGKGRKN